MALDGLAKKHYRRNGKVSNNIQYKFNEDKLVKEIQQYIDTTYSQHYASDKYQATDVIIDSGHGEGFALGNIMKYAKRYGNKEGKNRKDLMKILHYGIIMLHIHDDEVKRFFRTGD
jgi:membrane-anchored protein YejM (alkaline phosphatase superfamily)